MIDKIKPVMDWISTNWLVIALVASEAAALLPTKFNGIIQGALRILGKIFEKKK